MNKLKLVLGIILFLIGLGCLGYTIVMQCILKYQMYGLIFNGVVVHWSLWFLFGIIPFCIGLYILIYNWE